MSLENLQVRALFYSLNDHESGRVFETEQSHYIQQQIKKNMGKSAAEILSIAAEESPEEFNRVSKQIDRLTNEARDNFARQWGQPITLPSGDNEFIHQGNYIRGELPIMPDGLRWPDIVIPNHNNQ